MSIWNVLKPTRLSTQKKECIEIIWIFNIQMYPFDIIFASTRGCACIFFALASMFFIWVSYRSCFLEILIILTLHLALTCHLFLYISYSFLFI